MDGELYALAYPFGYYDLEADQVMGEAGYLLTVTTDDRPNRLKPHDIKCLRLMGRINVTDRMSSEDLISRLDQFSSQD